LLVIGTIGSFSKFSPTKIVRLVPCNGAGAPTPD
jgi:hypothetical protein